MNPARAELFAKFFPDGVPTLWSPMLTPFRSAGRIDRKRLEAHLSFLAPHIGGILIPGSTGEGWEMGPAMERRVVDVALPHARRAGLHVLIGVLRTDAAEAERMVRETSEQFCRATRCDDPIEAMARAGVSGFTICPPKGSRLSQRQISEGVARVLNVGVPVALYQLPQVTENEMSPATVADLARRFPNLLLFKDTSGADRVINSGRDLAGVFCVRGAEGGYNTWTRDGGGPYDGMLLSTTNAFAPQLARILKLLVAGKITEAQRLEQRVDAVVTTMFEAVAEIEYGNAFTNANKALEHWMAYGPDGMRVAPPRLISGFALPRDILYIARDALKRARLMPRRGYLS